MIAGAVQHRRDTSAGDADENKTTRRSAGRVGTKSWRTGLTSLFIGKPEIYHENASSDGGWEGTRPFRHRCETPRSALITVLCA